MEFLPLLRARKGLMMKRYRKKSSPPQRPADAAETTNRATISTKSLLINKAWPTTGGSWGKIDGNAGWVITTKHMNAAPPKAANGVKNPNIRQTPIAVNP